MIACEVPSNSSIVDDIVTSDNFERERERVLKHSSNLYDCDCTSSKVVGGWLPH